MSINFTPVPAGVGGAGGTGGVESPRGNLGRRLFTACKGRAMRAARALSRMVDRVIHGQSRPATLRRAGAGGAPRAGLAPKDPAAAHAARRSSPPTLGAPSSPRLTAPSSPGAPYSPTLAAPSSSRLAAPPSPGMVSARSVPSGMMYGVPHGGSHGSSNETPYGTPYGSSYGRSGASSPTSLASIPPEGVRLKPGRFGGSRPPTPASDPQLPPPLPPRSPRQLHLYGAAPLPDTGDARAPMLVFPRPNPMGPITARVAPTEAPPAPPTPPGTSEPPR